MPGSVQMVRDAAKNRGATKPPGGRPARKAEPAQRLDYADKMLREARPRADIVASKRSTFGLSERAADSYIAKAREPGPSRRRTSATSRRRHPSRASKDSR